MSKQIKKNILWTLAAVLALIVYFERDTIAKGGKVFADLLIVTTIQSQTSTLAINGSNASAAASDGASIGIVAGSGIGVGVGSGGDIYAIAGAGSALGFGGKITILGGDSGGTEASGSVTIDAGAPNGGTSGSISISTIQAESTTIGRTGKITNVVGTLQNNGVAISALTGTTQSGTPFLTVLGSTNLNSATGTNNTGVGNSAGNATTTNTDNSYFGQGSGALNTANQNSFFGSSSGASNTAGLRLCYFGYGSGANTTGDDNCFFGWTVGADNQGAGSRNTVIGSDAGSTPAAAVSDLTGVGYKAGRINTGVGNVFVGSNSGPVNIASTGQTFTGYQSGKLVTGADNSIYGYSAGDAFTTGARNSIFGKDSGGAAGATAMTDTAMFGYQTGLVNTADQNCFFGASSGAANTSGVGQAFFGYNAGKLVTGSNNTIFGFAAGDAFTTGSQNTLVGANAGGAAGATAMSDCTAVGKDALLLNTANQITAVGSLALDANTSGTGNTALGYSALSAISTSGDCTAMGISALAAATGASNTAFGARALDAVTTGASNVAIGVDAGGAAGGTGQSNNVFVGVSAGLVNTASTTTFIGKDAGLSNTSGSLNTSVGYQALGSNSNAGQSTAVGYQALLSSNGGTNTAVGTSAGDTISSGSGNVFIGANSDASVNSISSSIAIGSAATVTANNQLVFGSDGLQITDIYFSEGVTNASSLAFTINGTGGSGSDNAGADVILAGGKGTGLSASGYVGIKYPLLGTTGSTLQTLSTLVNRPIGVIYVSTADLTLTASTATTGTLIGAQTNAVPQGTLTLDAQLMRAGTIVRVTAYGRITQTAAGPTLAIAAKLGSTVIATGTIPASAGGITNGALKVEFNLICRSTGASGTVQGDGEIFVNTTAGTLLDMVTMYQAVTTKDTTASNAIDMFGTWSANTAGNAATFTNVTVEFR